MFHRSSIMMIAAALAAAIAIPAGDIRAADEAQYPNWTGNAGAAARVAYKEAK